MPARTRTHRPLALIGWILIALGAASLAGCNTFKGLGQDVQNAAESTEKAIDRATD